MDFHLILDYPEENHFTGLSVKKVNWMSEVSTDYLFGGYNDFNPSIFKSIDHVKYLPRQDIKLVLCVAFLPMMFELDIQQQSIDAINSTPNTYFWIFCPHEHITDISLVVKECNRVGIQLDKVIFSSCNVENNGKDSNGITHYGFDDWHETRYRYNVRAYRNIGFIHPSRKEAQLRTAQKKFICLLRNNKEHRYSLYYYLNKTETVDSGHVSYHCNKPNQPGYSSGDYAEKLKRAVYLGLLDPNDLDHALESHFMRPDRTLDELDAIKDNNRKTIEPFYLDSLISIVSESNTENIFNTEKVFKAITHSHPFVLQSSPKCIEDLERKGYKLYDDILGYKSIREPKQTEDFLLWLKDNPQTRLGALVESKWDRVVYNYNHFFKRQVYLKTHLKNIQKEVR